MNVNVGCCGFSIGRREYFRRFRVVEIQQTFYASTPMFVPAANMGRGVMLTRHALEGSIRSTVARRDFVPSSTSFPFADFLTEENLPWHRSRRAP